MPSIARSRRKGASKYVPSDQDQRTVRTMVSVGINQNDICTALGITVPTLHRHFRNELDSAYTRLVARMRVALIQKAEAGDSLCLIHVNKCLGWNERFVIQDERADVDPRTLTDAELDAKLVRLYRTPDVQRVLKAAGAVPKPVRVVN